MATPPIRGLFITGTDTGVGKTRAATALAHALADRGAPLRVRKPVESGCPHDLLPEDAEALRQAAGARESLERVCRYRLRAALSPERAAALEGVALELGMLRQACLDGVQAGDVLLVEGAGGLYSPIAQGALNADLAAGLGLPLLLVAADRLGTINHTLLALEAARQRGLAVAGVVLSQPQPGGDAAMDNAGELERWLRGPVIRLAHGGRPGPDAWRREAGAFAALADRLCGSVPAAIHA